MKCPRCYRRAKVIDTLLVDETNDRYRRYKCDTCGTLFHTIEFVIEYDKSVSEAWRVKNTAKLRKKKGE